MTDLEDRYRAAAVHATRSLPGGLSGTPAEQLRLLADEAADLDEPERWDRYGERGPVAELEQQVAELLAKPAAVMFPSGVMAQQAALRVWVDRMGSDRVAIPELSHLLQHEQDGPRLLHGFRYELLTRGPQIPTATHLDKIPGRLAAALLELPLHIDGARIWESQPHLDHSLAEIAALADSIYVSFYKGLRGLAGAAVACAEDVAAELRQWRTRHGGTLMTLYPYAVSALRGLRVELPRMGEYHARAKQLAAGLRDSGFATTPEVPHVNAFRLLAPVPVEEAMTRILAVLEGERLQLTPPWSPADVPGWSWTELTVGPDTMTWQVPEAVDRLRATLLG